MSLIAALFLTVAFAQVESPGDLPPSPMEPPPAAESPALGESPESVTGGVSAEGASPPADSGAPLEEQTVESAKEPADEEALPVRTSDLQSTDEADDERLEALLASPTRSLEEYEKARREHLHRTSIPEWSVNLTLAPKAFSNADLRVSPTGATGGATSSPTLLGLLLSGEYMFFKQAGLLSAGMEAGIYTSTTNDQFSGLATGFQGGGPYAQYQGHFLPFQWVVPSIRAQYELIRYNYTFLENKVTGNRLRPRLDLGLLVFLNLFESSSAAQMQGNYGVKRTYLGAYYTVANDSKKEDFDLSERTFRIALRFEH